MYLLQPCDEILHRKGEKMKRVVFCPKCMKANEFDCVGTIKHDYDRFCGDTFFALGRCHCGFEMVLDWFWEIPVEERRRS